jgi:hypothetical protein
MMDGNLVELERLNAYIILIEYKREVWFSRQYFGQRVAPQDRIAGPSAPFLKRENSLRVFFDLHKSNQALLTNQTMQGRSSTAELTGNSNNW